uniref:Uncharacterized protein n=1 Tax=Chromera velia CCMP2878 TaxID=1169474 RepID=A0A0G4HN85_9ALVE|eukprot:Cvel_29429.t1-p1 / transcript=Cvel_29429.t1 / gene=Cvel_29429 / organism=Chromera_velia_CCMP2878 / gene_product=hypothetical protein / transcript_product=hypothetical protein / location=Cvel_scaffold4020:6192-6548(+) / protein_length=119 / sequence_SO=supercontig / SO=protein_coding / is_pseudo=false
MGSGIWWIQKPGEQTERSALLPAVSPSTAAAAVGTKEVLVVPRHEPLQEELCAQACGAAQNRALPLGSPSPQPRSQQKPAAAVFLVLLWGTGREMTTLRGAECSAFPQRAGFQSLCVAC